VELHTSGVSCYQSDLCDLALAPSTPSRPKPEVNFEQRLSHVGWL
jgi:hypothetical protein